MNNQIPQKFVSTMQDLGNSRHIRETPEFLFIVAVKHQLLVNGFDLATSNRLASEQEVPLPLGATPEQVKDMGYYYAELVTTCHGDLSAVGKFDDPITEAGLLAQRLVRKALA